jgi:putative inorganic carbon (HCO3(-)) transporter
LIALITKSIKNQTIDIKDLYALKLGSLWLALKSEHLSLWMLCVYFFFEYIRPQTLYPGMDILPWGQLFLIASLITAIIDRSVSITPNVINVWFMYFTLIIVISGFTAFIPAQSLNYWTAFGSWFIVYFLVTSVVNTEQRLILFILAYCLFSFKMSQNGVVSWAGRGFSFRAIGLFGSPGWFKNSGEFAIQMLIFSPIALAIVLSFREYWGKKKKWILYICAASGFIAVIGASSRGSQLGLAVVGIWFLLKQKNGFKGLVILLILGSLLFILLPDAQIQRFNEMGEDRNSLQRLAYWRYALNEVIPNNLLLGLGYNNWMAYLSSMVPEGMGPMQMNQESHNIYIQAASELGLLGLGGFVMLFIYAFVNNARTRKMAIGIDNKFLFNLSYGLDAGLIGYLVAGTFVTVLYYPFFWVQIAMIVMLNNIAKKKIAGTIP